jgi:hypothetical protein
MGSTAPVIVVSDPGSGDVAVGACSVCVFSFPGVLPTSSVSGARHRAPNVVVCLMMRLAKMDILDAVNLVNTGGAKRGYAMSSQVNCCFHSLHIGSGNCTLAILIAATLPLAVPLATCLGSWLHQDGAR